MTSVVCRWNIVGLSVARGEEMVGRLMRSKKAQQALRLVESLCGIAKGNWLIAYIYCTFVWMGICHLRWGKEVDGMMTVGGWEGAVAGCGSGCWPGLASG